MNNLSEELFEEYLNQRNLKFKYENLPGKKQPDYHIFTDSGNIICEVKEFNSKGRDPYQPIREKINQAGRQFKEYKELPCVLVLSNSKNVMISLSDDWIIGAMYGNLSMQFNINQPVTKKPYIYCGIGGKLRNYNTTISAVAVLEKVIPKSDKIIIEREGCKNIPANKYGYKEPKKIAERIYQVALKYPHLGEKVLRLRIYHNWRAKNPLNKIFFCGEEDVNITQPNPT